MSLKVMVTDGEERAALSIVRSLGRAGYLVDVVAPGRSSLAGASRFAETSLLAVDPKVDPDRFRNEVRSHIEARGTQLLIPTSEAALLSLLPLRDELPGLTIPFPTLEAFRGISDKSSLMKVAGEVGIRVPRQATLAEAADLSDTMDSLAFPLVVKPARSIVPIVGADGALRYHRSRVGYAANPEELAELLRPLPPECYPLLLQERIQGAGIGIFLLLWEGDLHAAFAHRRIREKPPSGGVSVLRESIPPDPGLVYRSRLLLERFGWEGVAMIEFKEDRHGGEPALMEVNGRFWGSLQLAVDSGVDFPLLLVRAALGDRVEPPVSYRAGLRSRWWWGEVDHLAGLLHRGTPLPNGGSRLGAIASALGGWVTPARSEVFRWTDPSPAFHETREWVARGIAR